MLATYLHHAALAQTVAITGSATAARLISELAAQLAAVLVRRDELKQEIERAFALPEVVLSRREFLEQHHSGDPA
jgi:hypothetical protein